jgi:LuxR family maltose regulon positive regulatory protein
MPDQADVADRPIERPDLGTGRCEVTRALARPTRVALQAAATVDGTGAHLVVGDISAERHEPAGSVADQAEPLLAAKFAVPSAPRFMVYRRRLADRLTAAVAGPMTVVTGPAGTGKTEMVASWARAGSADTVVWITLDEADSPASAFWSYVIEGLHRAGVALSSTIGYPVSSRAGVDRSFLIRLAAELADRPRPITLVLDETSALTDPTWAVDLDFVVRHCRNRLRLVLVGRWDPPLRLSRYRLAGELTDIRRADLAFTTEETAELLAQHGVTIDGAALAKLQKHTEGWAAGLRLFAIALQHRADADTVLAHITGDEASIAEYFLSEVLRSQLLEVRQLLRNTSIVDTITPELAAVLTDRHDAGQMLSRLERQNAFVQSVPGQPTAYQYHPLFAELLRAELAGHPELHQRAHRRAAAWFGMRGDTLRAVRHWVAAEDWTYAAATVVNHLAVGQLAIGGASDPLGALFADLPAESDDASCRLIAAALALAAGDLTRSTRHLAHAQPVIADHPGRHGRPSVLVHTLLDILAAHARRDAARVLERAPDALSLLAQAPHEQVDSHPEIRTLLQLAIGTAHSWQGTVDAATGALTQAAAAAAAAGCRPVQVESLAHRSLIEAYRGRLRRATALADQAVALADHGGEGPDRPPVAAELTHAWVAMDRYDIKAAERHLRTAEPHCRPGDGLAIAALALLRSRFERASGDLRAATRIVHDASAAVGADGAPAWLRRQITLTEARLLSLTGRPDDALTMLDTMADKDSSEVTVVRADARRAGGDPDGARDTVQPLTASADVPAAVAVDAWLLLAGIAADAGDVRVAQHASRHAVGLASGESLRRPFHETGGPLRRILRAHADLPGSHSIAQRPGDRAAAVPVVVEPLSTREMEVLKHLSEMLGTEQIAATMYVSINTVKSHIRSILRKLSAPRRNDAVRRARALGII